MKFSYQLGRWLVGLALLSALIITLNPFGPAPSTIVPVSHKGVIDLSRWQTNPKHPVNLDGQWLFYWQQLLNPAQLDAPPEPPRRVEVPGYWSAQNSLPNEGHGTYTLTIKGLKAQQYALMVPTTYTANKIWLDFCRGLSPPVAGSGTLTHPTLAHLCLNPSSHSS